VPLATSVFNEHMPSANQISAPPPLLSPITPSDLLAPPTQGTVTMAGLRENVSVCLLYSRAWLAGVGCIPLHNKVGNQPQSQGRSASAPVEPWCGCGETETNIKLILHIAEG
jgi:hypothetical protein